jgi:hypothetical protein
VKAELTSAFDVYFEEFKRCSEGKCYWALLHLAIVIPDVCGALESPSGRAKPERYERWCNRYLQHPTLTGEEWWDMRCVLLHQGRTLPNPNRGRWRAYSFTQPQARVFAHRKADGTTLQLDVERVAKEIRDGVARWIDTVSSANPTSELYLNVQRNLASLARLSERTFRWLGGVTFTVTSSATGSLPPRTP